MEQLFLTLGKTVCHQIAERTFFVSGRQLPLCARCTGIYIGVFSSFLYLAAQKRLKGDKPVSAAFGVLLALGMMPLVLDGVSSYMLLRETNNIIRLITGILFGYGLPVLYVLLYNFEPAAENNRIIIKKNYEILYILMLSIILSSLVFTGSFAAWLLLSILLCLSVPASLLSAILVVCKKLLSTKGLKK